MLSKVTRSKVIHSSIHRDNSPTSKDILNKTTPNKAIHSNNNTRSSTSRVSNPWLTRSSSNSKAA